MRSRKILAALGLAVCLLALVAAGCGGGSGSPGVANLTGTAGTTTSAAPSGASNNQSGSSSGSSGNFALAMQLPGRDGVKFAACMRKHGVPNFPDPDSQGKLSIKSGSGIDPRSPKFQAAQQTCQKVLPNGGKPTAAQQAQQLQAATAFAACMRKHGLKNFPDPSSQGGIQIDPSSGIDPNSAAFQAAQKACGSLLGHNGGPVTGSAGG